MTTKSKRLEEVENKLNLNSNPVIVIRQIDEHTLKHGGKKYEIPRGVDISDFINKKFKGRKVILDDIF